MEAEVALSVPVGLRIEAQCQLAFLSQGKGLEGCFDVTAVEPGFAGLSSCYTGPSSPAPHP